MELHDRFISVEEACEFLNIKKSWLYQNHKFEGMPSYRIKRKLLFKTDELSEWMRSRR
jgi:excisionase family DNA binding protein